MNSRSINALVDRPAAPDSATGQRNATALQYHFGGKRELVWAIIERHTPPPDELQAVRDDLASKQDDPRALVEAIVRRLAASLVTEEGRILYDSDEVSSVTLVQAHFEPCLRT